MEQTILRGTVAAVVYQNEENGYAVLRLKTEGGETVTVVGTIPLLCVGGEAGRDRQVGPPCQLRAAVCR